MFWPPWCEASKFKYKVVLVWYRRSGISTKLFLNLVIQFYLNNATHLHQLTSHKTTSGPQHGGGIVTIDYCDVTSPYVENEATLNADRLNKLGNLTAQISVLYINSVT